MSISTAPRVPGRRPACSSSISARSVDSPITRAVRAVVETLERRVLLSVLPASVHASADAVYAISGDAVSGFNVTLSAGVFAIDSNVGAPAADWPQLSLTVTGSAYVAVNSQLTLNGLTLSGSANLVTGSGGGGVSANSLYIGPGGLSMPNDPATGFPGAKLDLMDNDMILQGAGSAGVSQAKALIIDGRRGTWTGTGLTSSDAAGAWNSSVRTALGFGLNRALGVHFDSVDGMLHPDGSVLDGTDVIVRYCLVGDLNLDQRVNNVDYTNFSNNMNSHLPTVWASGDVNYSGMTNNADFALFSPNMNMNLTDPPFQRTLVPVGLQINAVEGQPFSGTVATFTDTRNTIANPTTADSYTASIAWGTGTFSSSGVTIAPDTDPADPAGTYLINATSPGPLANPDALIAVMVQYSATSGLQGREASLGEPFLSTSAVSDLSATAISTSEIDLSWAINANNVSAIEVDSSTDGFATYTTTMLGGTATGCNFTGLAEGSHHFYRVCAIQPGGPSAFAGPVGLYAIPMVSSPTAAAVSTSATNLAWGAVSSPGATGIEVWRSADGITYSLLATLSPGATSYADTGLPEATPYAYEVRVVEGSVASDFSTVYAVTIPTAPTGLTATADGGAVDLAWADDSVSNGAYNIYRSTDGSSFTLIDTVPSNTMTYVDQSAPDGSADYYKVSAADDGGESSLSSVATATPVVPLRLTDDPAIVGSTAAPRAAYSVLHGHTLSIIAPIDGVLANDLDPNGWTPAVASHASPSHGTLTLNSDGTFIYAADANFTGQDSFTYTATDSIGATSNAATVTINVTDQMPTVLSTYIGLSQALGSGGTPLGYAAPFSGTLNAADADGDPLTYSLVSGPTSDQGAFTLNTSTGAYTFTPNPANTQMGNLDVVFRVNDGALTSNLASETFPGYTISGGVMTLNPLPSVGGNQGFSIPQNGALEVGPGGLLQGAHDFDIVTPDTDLPIVDSALIESPQHGSVTAITTTDGSFAYQPTAGFVGRDWFTYRLKDGDKPSDYATIFIDVLPLNISLSVGGLASGDPAAVIPTVAAPLNGAAFVALHMNGIAALPQGSTVTLSMNSDVVPDLNVSTLPPGTSGNTQLIGHDAGTSTYTWTVGTNSPPPYVWAAGLAGTDYDQVLFHLTVLVAPTIIGTPTVPTPAASQPIVGVQNGTVAGKGGYLVALDGTADAEPDNSNIWQFYNQHYTGARQYNRGPGNSVDHPNAASRTFLIAFGDAEALSIERRALAKLNNFYQNPANMGVELDTIGYSRGAFEAVALVNDLLRKGIPVQSTKYTTRGIFGVPISTGYTTYRPMPQLRFVGLISPVMGPEKVPYLWDYSVPAGTHWMYQGLDKDLAGINPILTQFPMSRPAGTAGHDKVYQLGHQEVGHNQGVLKDMLAEAKNAGVPVK